MGNSNFGIDPAVMHRLAQEVKEVVALGVQVGIVIGGGNLFRGAALTATLGMRRTTADALGMLATWRVVSKTESDAAATLPIDAKPRQALS